MVSVQERKRPYQKCEVSKPLSVHIRPYLGLLARDPKRSERHALVALIDRAAWDSGYGLQHVISHFLHKLPALLRRKPIWELL